jgi:hypothetical protein
MYLSVTEVCCVSVLRDLLSLLYDPYVTYDGGGGGGQRGVRGQQEARGGGVQQQRAVAQPAQRRHRPAFQHAPRYRCSNGDIHTHILQGVWFHQAEIYPCQKVYQSIIYARINKLY